jgi:phosphoglycerol transferase MdoB-like AlkP superfamily enzyme
MAVNSLFAKSRFTIVLLFLLINLGAFALLRVALLIRQLADIDSPIYQIALTFFIGMVHDLAFFSYLLIPFVLYLLVLPNRIYQSKAHKIIGISAFIICLYSLLFIELSEWTFWDEFGVRFNFIAVDYLIYTHEVVSNIIESYPMGWLLLGILISTAICFWLVRRALSHTFNVHESFLSRLKITGGLLLLPLISYTAVGPAWSQFSTNSYLNELATNGPYQFFSAFRNNELDYRHFYKTGDDRQLSSVIKKQLGIEDASGELYNIKRMIKPAGKEKRLNIILITVESLSADFLATFGNKQNITPFMDEWFKEGLLFTNFYATGTRTVRSLESLTLSIPPLPG